MRNSYTQTLFAVIFHQSEEFKDMSGGWNSKTGMVDFLTGHKSGQESWGKDVQEMACGRLAKTSKLCWCRPKDLGLKFSQRAP